MNSDQIEQAPKPTVVIAEVGLSHDGSLSLAHSMIWEAAKSGADFVKFQVHLAEFESTRVEPFRVHGFQSDFSRFDYWRRTAFSFDDWQKLCGSADEAGIGILFSTFSVEGLDLVKSLGANAIKIGSAESRFPFFVEAAAERFDELLVSTGMSTWSEIDELVTQLVDSGRRFSIFHCLSEYPTALGRMNLLLIDELRTRYACPVGFSAHSSHTSPAMAAIAMGVSHVEVHVTFDRGIMGPDSSSSLTFTELKQVSDFRSHVAEMTRELIDKDELAEQMKQLRTIFGRSVALRKKLQKGEILKQDNLILKKPGGGLTENEARGLLGKRAIRDISPDELISRELFN